MKEHLLKWVMKFANQQGAANLVNRKSPASSIARHIIDTGHIVDLTAAFSILMKHTNQRVLRFAEAVAIQSYNPEVCV